MAKNAKGQTPPDAAVACERGEVLNAMLLACAGSGPGGAAHAGEGAPALPSTSDAAVKLAAHGSKAAGDTVLAAAEGTTASAGECKKSATTIGGGGKEGGSVGAGTVVVAAMRKLLSDGAVPDTWAPNGSSALMLAASSNHVAALAVLLDAGATLELQVRWARAVPGGGVFCYWLSV